MKTKKYIMEIRTELILQLFDKGYTKSDIARVFNIHKSIITNIMKTHAKEYILKNSD